ncbi:hypothetical protein SNE40_003569 [Patella caerulea]|uniref:G-protein coupled receptors family 1 profile domain-containing protein n=1 Tax=Patella caerulea TaxID=87958 RepID=A0AAN8KBJ0_PATCE
MCFFISPTVVTESILSLTLNRHHPVLCGLCYSSARGTELTLSVNLLLLTIRRWKKIKTMDCGSNGFRKVELIYVGVAWSSGITLTIILMTLVLNQNLDANLLSNDCQTMRLQPGHHLSIINYLYLLILTISAIIILCANLSILKFLNKPLISPVASVRPLPFSVCPNNLRSIITDENKTKEYTCTDEELINSKCLEDSCISCQKSFSGCHKSLQSVQPPPSVLDSCISTRNVTSPVSDNGTVHSFHESFSTDSEMQAFIISNKSETDSISSFKYKNISDSLNSELLSQITPHQQEDNIKENQKNSVVRTSIIRFDYTIAEKNKFGDLDMCSSVSSLQELCSPKSEESLLKLSKIETSYSSKYGECSKLVISDSDVVHTNVSTGFNETVESETGVFTISQASLSPNKMSATQTNVKSPSPIGKLTTPNKRNKQKRKWNSMDYIKKISTQHNRIKKNSVGIGDPVFVNNMELRSSVTSHQSNLESLVSTVNKTSIVPLPHVQFKLTCSFENGPHSFKRRQAVISDEGYQHIFPHANIQESTSKDSDRLGNNSRHEHQNFNPRKSNFAYSNANINCSWNGRNMNMPVAFTRRFRMKKIVFRNLMIQLIIYFVFLLPGYLESVVPYLRAQPMIQSLAYFTDSVEFVLFAINPFLYIMKNKSLMNEL